MNGFAKDSRYVVFQDGQDALHFVLRCFISIQECCATLHLVSKQWRRMCQWCLHAHRQSYSSLHSWATVLSENMVSQRRYRIPLSFATSGRIYKIKDTIDPNCDPYQGWQKHRVHETLEVELKRALHKVVAALHVQHVPRSCNLDNIDQNVKGCPLLLERFASNWSARNTLNPALNSGNNDVFKSYFKCGESFDEISLCNISLLKNLVKMQKNI